MSEVQPGDAAGAETLEIMSAAPRYNAWQYDAIARWIGKRVIEVGSGIGNMSAHILSRRATRLLTDTDAWYRSELAKRFADRPEVRIDSLTLPDAEAPARFAEHRLDTAVALNVVEHIEDDVGTLDTLRRIVGRGGRVVILVPALDALYGTLDEELGHFRRYTRQRLQDAFAQAGLDMVHLQWFNRVGTLGWWFNARIRMARRIPIGQLKTFDSLVPLLRFERFLPLPFGQSLIAVGSPR
ncbi:MAG: methyltransferase domain-containing protein [Gemmatimonadales bacterium]